MKSRFVTDPQDPSDAFLDPAGAEFFTSFSSPASPDGRNPLAGGPTEILSSPALTSEAVASLGTQGSPGSTISMTTGGITINLLFDAAAMAAPASFRAGIQQAASLLTAAISDQITVNIKIDYSGTGGGAAAGPDNGQFLSYSTVKADLTNNATPGDTTFNALPGGTSIQGQSNVAVWNAQLKLWGVLGANDTTTDDGSATFATDINSNLLVGVALHELTHAMGRVPYGSQPDVFDLFRFTSPGARMFAGGNTAPAAYFSVDGGNTKLADFGQNSDPSDFLNSGVQGSNDPFNEFYGGSTLQSLTAADKELMDALGFHTAAVVTSVIESLGATSLVQAGSYYYLDSNSTGAGPQLKYGGSPVVTGEFTAASGGTWALIGAEQTATGYEVAWKVAEVDQYTVWNLDANGNYVSHSILPTSGSSLALENIEASFHQDLNGDGVIGVPAATSTVIEAFGSTSLVQTGSNYFLDSNSTGLGPELKYNGSPVVTGEFTAASGGTWALIGAEQTATGYEVAWKVAGVDQYTVWNLDANGNYVSHSILPTSGSSLALENIEASFHQDLNGDGVIGVPAATSTVIEAFGSTSLVQTGSNYFLDSNSTGLGPELKYNGSPVVTGEFTAAGGGTWTLIGAEQTATGYEVAWKVAGVDQYTVWNLDANGNYVSHSILPTSGTNVAIEIVETSFHQDLNSDGVIGVPSTSTVIEAFGSTSLVQTGSNYFLDSNSTGLGPELKYNGSPVVTGEFTAAGGGTWTLIGAEQTATGYEVAWKVAGVDQYTVWNLDANGNYVSHSILPTSGTNVAIEIVETSFHQDLNSDGVIGVPSTSTVIEAFGSTSLVQTGSNYFLDSNSTGLGPELKYNGSPVVTGEFTAAGGGTWTLIGAEQTAGGYEVAWKVAGVDQYTVWNLDANGNYVSHSILPTSGTNVAIEIVETSFHQDLNSDGVIGVPAATGASPSGPASQGAMVTVANNDTFVFTGGRADAAPTPGNTGAMERDDFSAAGIPPAFWHDAQNILPQTLFPSANAGHDPVVSPDNHDSATATNFALLDHHDGFLIR